MVTIHIVISKAGFGLGPPGFALEVLENSGFLVETIFYEKSIRFEAAAAAVAGSGHASLINGVLSPSKFVACLHHRWQLPLLQHCCF